MGNGKSLTYMTISNNIRYVAFQFSVFSKYLYLIDEILSMRGGGYSEVELTHYIKKMFLIISIMLISSIVYATWGHFNCGG